MKTLRLLKVKIHSNLPNSLFLNITANKNKRGPKNAANITKGDIKDRKTFIIKNVVKGESSRRPKQFVLVIKWDHLTMRRE